MWHLLGKPTWCQLTVTNTTYWCWGSRYEKKQLKQRQNYSFWNWKSYQANLMQYHHKKLWRFTSFGSLPFQKQRIDTTVPTKSAGSCPTWSSPWAQLNMIHSYCCVIMFPLSKWHTQIHLKIWCWHFSPHMFHTKTLSPFDVCQLVMRYSVLVSHLWSEPTAHLIQQLRSTRRIPRKQRKPHPPWEGAAPPKNNWQVLIPQPIISFARHLVGKWWTLAIFCSWILMTKQGEQ